MVGILTLHYGYNEGAILQAYALARLLGDYLNEEVRIIDHRYPKKVDIYSRHMDPRKEALKSAVDSWLPLSRHKFITDNACPTWKYISDKCSGLVVGSDQVWRFLYRRSLGGLMYKQPDAFVGKCPNVYWPAPWINVPTCAYAASIGDQPSPPPPWSHQRKMRRVLERFKVVGVRDERTARFVEDVAPHCAERIRLCPDPTIIFRWDYSGARLSLSSKAERVGVSLDSRYCLVALEMSDYARAIAGRLKDAGWLVVGYGSDETYSDVSFAKVGITPLEWIALIGSAGLVITDRYHAFIFSILQGRPCLVFDRARQKFRVEASRISSLASRIGYDRYVLTIGMPVDDVVEMARAVRLDWRTVKNNLEEFKRVGERVIVEIAQAVKGDTRVEKTNR